ncbi:MAG TPA: 30S ribosomal protein S18 [Candidatus Paceibacterota bacterium]|nr:30S ribosomal protein S18 [Candidatus Paceibacterota bacterium]
MIRRKPQNYLSANHIKYVDYKDTELLKMFLNPHGQLLSHKRSGLNQKQQRALALAVKRGRFMGLLPYIAS